MLSLLLMTVSIPLFGFPISADPDLSSNISCPPLEAISDHHLPLLPDHYQLQIEATLQQKNITMDITEYFDFPEKRISVVISKSGTEEIWIYDAKKHETSKIINDECISLEKSPFNPFDLDFSPEVAFIRSVSDVLQIVQKSNVTLTSNSEIVRGIPVQKWVSCIPVTSRDVLLTWTLYFTLPGYATPSGAQEIPVRIVLQGEPIGSYGAKYYNIYDIVAYKPGRVKDITVFQLPQGIVCRGRPTARFMPNLDDVFSVSIETILDDNKTITNAKHYFNFKIGLAAYELRPHPLDRRILSPYFSKTFGSKQHRVVYDFRLGLQYIIDKHSSNCYTDPITRDAIDAMPEENHQYVKMRHASELMDMKTLRFTYIGQRYMHDVPCDVWVTHREGWPRIADEILIEANTTLEIYFSQENWTIEVQNAPKQVLMGVVMITSYYNASCNKRWTSTVHNHFYDYSNERPSWQYFDITPCLTKMNRLFLVLVLEVDFEVLAAGSLELAEDSIRQSIAEKCGISPLRVTNIFLEYSEKGSVDVWFVMLEQSRVRGNVQEINQELSLEDAFSYFKKICSTGNVSLRVTIKEGLDQEFKVRKSSLEKTSEILHPGGRPMKLEYIASGYTKDAMAGVSISMLLLGIILGVCLGFVLWKRNQGIRYRLQV